MDGRQRMAAIRAAIVALALVANLVPAATASASPARAVPSAVVPASTLSPFASSSETLVAPGVSWRRGSWTTTNGLQAVHLLDVDPADPGIGIETAGPGAGVDARETVRTQAGRVSRNGHRVVVAVNGDVWSTDSASGTVAPIGLQVRAGELLTGARRARPTLGFGADEVPRVGDVAVTASVTLPDGSTPLVIDRINKPRPSGELVLYTARWGASTSTLADGVEVVLTGALLPLRVTGTWTGTVGTVIPVGGNTPIPAGALVLSAQGADATILGSLVVGSAVTISTSITPGWEDVVEAIGGREWLVEDGAVGIRPVSTITTAAHPRTAIGVRPDGRLLFATVDGRQPGYSTGVTAADLADLLLQEGATDAIMLDGGGSTTTLVRNPGDVGVTLANRPSDGTERAVDNALLVVSSVPTGALAGLFVRPDKARLVVGQTTSFTAKGVDAAVNAVPIAATSVTWSLDGTGGTISAAGAFRARAPGSATVTARVGGVTAAGAITVVADTFPPLAATPAIRLHRDGRIDSGSVPVAVTWAAATDTGTGVARYELRRRFDGAAWTPVALPSPTTRSIDQRLPPGRAVQYQVRAIDRAGNVGAWRTAAGLRLRLVSEASSAVRYTGTWRKRLGSTYLGGSLRAASRGGATATFTFTGRQVAWIAARGPGRGSARVYVDGSFVSVVSLWSRALVPRRAVYTSAWATSGVHRITIRVSGTAGHPRVDVDGFVFVEAATLLPVPVSTAPPAQ